MEKEHILKNRLLGKELLILFLLTLIVRLVGINHLPFDDEMFHVLAAQSWATEGTLQMGDGAYTRASFFTIGVGYLFRIFGESLIIARLPALVFGTMWVLALFLWVRTTISRNAAWIAAVLFSLAPHAIELSQLCRFYTLHGFAFFLSAIGVYTLLEKQHSILMNLTVVIGTSLSFMLALHLQFTTMIGLAALMTWVTVELATRWLRRGLSLEIKIWGGVCLIGIVGAVFVVLFQPSIIQGMLQLFSQSAYWNVGEGFLSYHRLFLGQYPSLWPLFPLGMIVAIVCKPKEGLFCSCVFVVAFLLHSLAGLKAERYIFYAVPFFFAICGIVFAELQPYARSLVAFIVERISQNYFSRLKSVGMTNSLQWCVIIIVALFLIGSNGTFPRMARAVMGESYYFGLNQSNWEAVQEELSPYIENASVIITTNITKSLYYHGRFDIALNKSVIVEQLNGKEFATDPRTGRPVISSEESLRIVLSCFPDGLFVGESGEWRFGPRINDAGADLLESHARRIPLPAESRIMAFVWERPLISEKIQCHDDSPAYALASNRNIDSPSK